MVVLKFRFIWWMSAHMQKHDVIQVNLRLARWIKNDREGGRNDSLFRCSLLAHPLGWRLLDSWRWCLYRSGIWDSLGLAWGRCRDSWCCAVCGLRAVRDWWCVRCVVLHHPPTPHARGLFLAWGDRPWEPSRPLYISRMKDRPWEAQPSILALIAAICFSTGIKGFLLVLGAWCWQCAVVKDWKEVECGTVRTQDVNMMGDLWMRGQINKLTAPWIAILLKPTVPKPTVYKFPFALVEQIVVRNTSITLLGNTITCGRRFKSPKTVIKIILTLLGACRCLGCVCVKDWKEVKYGAGVRAQDVKMIGDLSMRGQINKLTAHWNAIQLFRTIFERTGCKRPFALVKPKVVRITIITIVNTLSPKTVINIILTLLGACHWSLGCAGVIDWKEVKCGAVRAQDVKMIGDL